MLGFEMINMVGSYWHVIYPVYIFSLTVTLISKSVCKCATLLNEGPMIIALSQAKLGLFKCSSFRIENPITHRRKADKI